MYAQSSPTPTTRRRPGFLRCQLLALLCSAGLTQAQEILPRADFGNVFPSPESRQLADWVVDAQDNQALPFVIVDKAAARVFVFTASGRLQAAAPALLGLARGDDSEPGIGDLPLSRIPPAHRTTPAGRFVADLGRNTRGQDILWVDYANAISLHRVATGNARERRQERLNSPGIDDNRISYGCINVPVEFYERFIRPAFSQSSGIVYVLPETRPAQAVFASYDVDARRMQEKNVQLASQSESSSPP